MTLVLPTIDLILLLETLEPAVISPKYATFPFETLHMLLSLIESFMLPFKLLYWI